MRLIKSILTLVMICCAISSASAQKQVAVYVTGDREQAIKKVLGSKMVTYITESDNFTAVERTADFLNALTSEQDYQSSGEVSNSQIVKLGQQFGANYVAVVDVSELFGELFVSSRLIDVLTSQIIASYETSSAANDMATLTALANNVADGLILAPERKKKEKEKKQRAEAEAELRQRAIASLTPPGCVIVGDYIVINRKIPVNYTFNYYGVNLGFEADLPSGFKYADDGILDYIAKNCEDSNPLGKIIYDRDYWVTPNTVSTYCEDFTDYKIWFLPLYGFFLNEGLLRWNSSKAGGQTAVGALQYNKTNKLWEVVASSLHLFALAYRPFFTEEVIREEMNRIQAAEQAVPLIGTPTNTTD